MAAYYADLYVDQGSDYTVMLELADINGDPLDVTDYTFNGEFKQSFDSEESHSLTVTIADANTGNVAVSLSAANTASVEPGVYVYDIDISNSYLYVTKFRILEGTLTIRPSV